MYFDLFLPFPIPPSLETYKKKKKDKGNKGRVIQDDPVPPGPSNCWDGLSSMEKDGFARSLALSGHLGYSVVGCTLSSTEPSTLVRPCPFRDILPYPSLDPRSRGPEPAPELGPPNDSLKSAPTMVQISRYHMRLDDSRIHSLTGANTSLLREYDILSIQPTNDKALQLACTDLSNPGPNQLSIITLPLHEKPYHFRLNRKQIRQAQRNGVVFEITYAAGLFPPASIPLDTARRYRQNFLSNAREVIRVTGGKNVILSSGPGGSTESIRGPLDVINLATILGMPANLAKDAVSLSPKRVLLKAQARRTFKAILSMPKMVPAPGASEVQVDNDGELEGGRGTKRTTDTARDDDGKRPRVDRAEGD